MSVVGWHYPESSWELTGKSVLIISLQTFLLLCEFNTNNCFILQRLLAVLLFGKKGHAEVVVTCQEGGRERKKKTQNSKNNLNTWNMETESTHTSTLGMQMGRKRDKSKRERERVEGNEKRRGQSVTLPQQEKLTHVNNNNNNTDQQPESN